ncbi:MAG: VOC family protein [Acidimicrobiales bacterium]
MPEDRMTGDGAPGGGPTSARFTHVALPCGDLERSIAWYEAYTPLRALARFADTNGTSAWLGEGDAEAAAHPFVVVLVCFAAKAGTAQPHLRPFAHLGIELPDRADVDAMAERGRAAGCLAWEPVEIGPPVGYVCALADPDGNVVEFSFDQGVYAAVRGRVH